MLYKVLVVCVFQLIHAILRKKLTIYKKKEEKSKIKDGKTRR